MAHPGPYRLGDDQGGLVGRRRRPLPRSSRWRLLGLYWPQARLFPLWFLSRGRAMARRRRRVHRRGAHRVALMATRAATRYRRAPLLRRLSRTLFRVAARLRLARLANR